MNKLKAIFVSLLVFVGLEVLIKKQEWFWWIILCLVILVLGASLHIIKFSFKHKRRLNFIILPTFYIIGVLTFFIFLQEGAIRHLYILGVCIFLGILLLNNSEAAQKTLVFEQEKRKRSLINNIVTLLCAILIYSGVWGISLLLNWPVWMTILIFIVITSALTYQSLWFVELLERKVWLYILILALVIAEIGWCLVLWPVGFLAVGCVLFSIYFVFQGIVQAYLKQELTKKIVWQHLILSAVLLITSLSTAKWTY